MHRDWQRVKNQDSIQCTEVGSCVYCFYLSGSVEKNIGRKMGKWMRTRFENNKQW